MQGKPMAHLSNFKTADEERYWVLASERSEENAKLRARLATYEAALRELVAACTTGDTYSDGRAAGVRTPEREVLERARKALEDNT